MANGANKKGSLLRGDLDQWSFQASVGDAISLTASELGTNTPFHPWLRVHGPNGQLLGNVQGFRCVDAHFNAPLTGTYTVLVARFDGADGVGQYIVTLAQ